MQSTRDPLIYVQQLNPPKQKKARFVFDAAAKAKLKASIDATIPLHKETFMAQPAMAVGDMGGPVTPTGKIHTITEPYVPPAPKPKAATAEIGRTAPPPSPVERSQPAVQRFSNPEAPLPMTSSDQLLKELAEEDAGVALAVPEQAPAPEADDFNPDTILSRFKGTPEEITKQLAKSYANAEKRMRQKEQELNLLMKGQPAVTTPAPDAVPKPAMNLPGSNQIQVNPFDYKKAGDSFLDKPDEILKSLDEHVTTKSQSALMEMFLPVYTELLQNRLYRQHGDVVNEDNIEVIQAMARTMEGASDYEKLTNAAKKYKASLMPTHSTDADVADMQAAARTPSPQGKSASGKMYKGSEIRKLMQHRDYQRDPIHRERVDRLAAAGRIKWSE